MEGLLVILIFIAVVVAIVLGIVFLINLFKKAPGQTGSGLNIRGFLKFYLYFISFVTLVVTAFGLVVFINAALSYPLGYQFSYRTDQYYEPVTSPVKDPYAPEMNSPLNNRDVITIDGKKYYVDQKARTKDLVNGATLSLSMFILFLIHRLSIKFVETKDEEKLSGFKKSYLFVSLIMYSIFGIIAIPTAIYSIINYAVFDSGNLSSYNRSIQGSSLAAALVFVPIWLVYLARIIMLHKKTQGVVS